MYLPDFNNGKYPHLETLPGFDLPWQAVALVFFEMKGLVDGRKFAYWNTIW
jgi:hypothetical protein